MNKKTDNPDPPFEQALAQLEQIVEQMESGEQSLEESLQSFETGVKLMRHCQQVLEAAEQRVQILTESHDDAPLQPFEPSDD